MKNMRFNIKTLLVVVTLAAVCLAVVVGVRKQQQESRRDAFDGLRTANVLLLKSSQSEPDSIGYAEIWVNEKTPGCFEINGKEFSEQDAKKQLVKLRLWLERLQLGRIVFVDNEPGTAMSRNTTTSLVYSAGFTYVGGQPGVSSIGDRRTLFASKGLLYETESGRN